MQCKCGCVYDEKSRSFTKYCREHALKILRTRFEKQLAEANKKHGGR